MSEIIFHKPWMLLLLPLVGVFIVVFRLRMIKRRQDMQAFGDAAAGRPTMEASIECARVRATLGEMTGALENVFGRYRPSETAW